MEKEKTTISWRPDYDSQELYTSDWYKENGWDFVGCIVDIQLKRDDPERDDGKPEYFFVKYVGSVEGIDEDAETLGERTVFHFGVEKFNGKRWLFRPENIHVIREHHSQSVEKEKIESVMGFKCETPKVIDKERIELLEKAEEVDMVGGEYGACCY